MYKKFFIAILLILFFISVAYSADPFVVRVVYFEPADINTPQMVDTIQSRVVDAQLLYATEMIRHNYGNKTFKIERDANDKIVIHKLKGNQVAAHYSSDTHNRIENELPFEFSQNKNAEARDNVHLYVVGGIDRVNKTALGVGGPYHTGRSGGFALVAGNVITTSLVAHELGHAFGLYHTEVPYAVMGPGRESFLDYEARWLNRSHYFNDIHIRNDLPVFVSAGDIVSLDRFTLRFNFTVRSDSGLYQSQLVRRAQTFVVGSTSLEGNEAVGEIDAPRRFITNGDHIWYMIMDVHGNFSTKAFDNVIKPENIPPRVNTKPNGNKNPELIDDKLDEEIVEIDEIDCPTCDEDIEPRRVSASEKLTTTWGKMKRHLFYVR